MLVSAFFWLNIGCRFFLWLVVDFLRVDLYLKVVFELSLEVWVFERDCEHELGRVEGEDLVLLELLVELVDLEVGAVDPHWDVMDEVVEGVEEGEEREELGQLARNVLVARNEEERFRLVEVEQHYQGVETHS